MPDNTNLDRWLADLQTVPADGSPEDVASALIAIGVPANEAPLLARAILTGEDVGA